MGDCMFSVNLRLNNKRIIVLLVAAIAVTAALVTARYRSVTAQKPEAVKCSDTAEIAAYLKDFGLEVTECVVDEITVPEVFGKVYSDYNEIQKSQGFDLSEYKGKRLLRYTFAVVGEENCFAEVLTFNKTVVGADIYSVEADGFIKALK